jgi:hypothetical protein
MSWPSAYLGPVRQVGSHMWIGSVAGRRWHVDFIADLEADHPRHGTPYWVCWLDDPRGEWVGSLSEAARYLESKSGPEPDLIDHLRQHGPPSQSRVALFPRPVVPSLRPCPRGQEERR